MDTNRQKVLQCIIDLHNARRPAARVLIAQLLGEKLSVVDDAVKRLREDGLVRTVVPGVLEPVKQFPPDRPISRTSLPDGRTKIEVGDDLIELSPHETQVLGMMLMGDAQSMSYWHEERRSGEAIVRLEAEVRLLHKALRDARVAALRTRRGPHTQPDLFIEPEAATAAPRRRRIPA